MAKTTEYGFPYPVDADAPDGPKQLKELAEALDKVQWLEKAIKDGAVTSRKLKLSSGVVRSTSDLTLTSSYVGLPGSTIALPTLAVKSKLIVVTFFQFQCSGEGSNALGTLAVDEKADEVNTSGMGWGATVVQSNFNGLSEVYEQELAPGAHSIQLRAKGNKAAGGEAVANKGCSALWFLHAV